MNKSKRRLMRLSMLFLIFVLAFSTLSVNAADEKGTDALIKASPVRIGGANRFETSLNVADALKTSLGVDKFESVVIAYGRNFPDALAGGYLASKNDAPIITVDTINKKSTSSVNSVPNAINYLKENLIDGGKVYILGGTGVVSKDFADSLESNGYYVTRIAGNNRYTTNLLILNEAGKSEKGIFVCSGENFADALSASAVDMPILIVKDKITDEQLSYLVNYDPSNVYIVGGDKAVSTSVENAIEAKGLNITRIAGANRNATSVEIAKQFFNSDDVTTLTMAYSRDFPDGLSGGPLAASLGSPLILTETANYSAAKAYRQSTAAYMCVTLGGSTLISDEAVKDIMYNFITVKALYENQDDYKIIDVRATANFEAGHIAGSYPADVTSAVSAKDNTVEEAVNNIKAIIDEDPTTKYALMCNSGNSLARAATQILAAQGVATENIFTVQGGWKDWSSANYPVERSTSLVVDKEAGTATFKVTSNEKFFTEDNPAVSHLITSSVDTESQAHNALFDTDVKPLELYAALEELGGTAWSSTKDTKITKGQKIKDEDVKGTADSANYSKLKVEVYDGDTYLGELKDILKYQKNGVEQDPAISMVFAGNKVNQESTNTGCVACLFSCWAGVTSNEDVGFSMSSKDEDYFYVNKEVLNANHEYTFVYSIKEPEIVYNNKTVTETYAAIENPDVVILDSRKAADYKTSHIPGSVSASCASIVDPENNVDGEAADNVNAIVAKYGTDKTYYIACYSGNRYAKTATELLVAAGVDNANTFIITGGMKQWNTDYPSYVAKTYTSKNGFDFMNGITVENVKADVDGDRMFTVIDLRVQSLYDEGHIPGAVSAVQRDVSDEEAEANLKAVVESNPEGSKYVLVCYSGNSFANKARNTMVEKLGMDEKDILVLEGGNGAWTSAGYATEKTVVYNYKTVAETYAAIKNPDIVILDSRKTADYKTSHIPGAVSASCASIVDPDNNVDGEAADNVNAIVAKYGTDKEYYIACYSGNRYAKTATELLVAAGVDNANTFIITGGMKQWNSDYASYVAKTYTSSKGFDFMNGITIDQAKADIDSNKLYKYVDLRTQAEYDEAHMPGAVLAVQNGVTDDEAVANLKAVVDNSPAGTKYLLICNSGNGFANKGRNNLVNEIGVDEKDVIILEGGHNGWVAAGYPTETVGD